MENVGESRKDMNEVIQMVLENASNDEMKKLQRTLYMAIKQKEMEFRGVKEEEGEGILPMTAESGKVVDKFIIQVKEDSAGHEIMEVDPPTNVLVRQQFDQTGGSSRLYYLNHQENGIKLRREVEDLTIKKVDLLSKMTSELIYGKKLKTEFKLWLTKVETIMAEAENRENKLAEGRFMECEVLGRRLELEIGEADELYKKGNFAESVVEKIAGEGNETGMTSLVGMVGEGKTTIQNQQAVNLKFEDVDVGETSGNGRKDKEKNSSGVGNGTGKISIVGMGGKGETTIANKGPVTLTFGNIRL